MSTRPPPHLPSVVDIHNERSKIIQTDSFPSHQQRGQRTRQLTPTPPSPTAPRRQPTLFFRRRLVSLLEETSTTIVILLSSFSTHGLSRTHHRATCQPRLIFKFALAAPSLWKLRCYLFLLCPAFDCLSFQLACDRFIFDNCSDYDSSRTRLCFSFFSPISAGYHQQVQRIGHLVVLEIHFSSHLGC